MPLFGEDRRAYDIKWRKSRWLRLVEMAGGQCIQCGSFDRLEFDHIKPETKAFNIGASLSRAWKRLLVELKKCQLLCVDCHIEKSNVEKQLRSKSLEDMHGTCTGYNKYRCRCDLCKNWKREAHRRFRNKMAIMV